jgi:anti-anti-sigma factor
MDIQHRKLEKGTILTIGGRLDANHTKKAEDTFLALVKEGEKHFIFDLSPLEYISSAGLRVLLVAAKKTKALQGRLVLACLSEQVHEVFDMSGFSTIFTQCGTLEEAITALQEA